MSIGDDSLKELIESAVTEEGLTFVEVRIGHGKRKVMLQVFADRPGRITVDECARLSRKLEMVLDNEEAIDGSYILQVSSPGLDRSLRNKVEFGLRIGETIKLYYTDDDGNEKEFQGRLENADDDMVTVSNENGQVEVSYRNISKGQIIL